MTTTPTRRIFLLRAAACGGALAGAAGAGAATHVEETDENAVALGYRQDSAQVDGAKYPRHDPKQHCVDCAFWQGAASDPWAGCAMFGRKQVASGGWCSAWAKK
jgi:hypothetical protein